ncbi:Hypothetical protein GbCGDNIH4_1523 [Granulibacter bethesdensis CGDNIH4]|nr:Hypothetical protein GbCGDNIH4_1523 [Granulibacter bethesdensis CGDNIH4]
MRSHYNNNFMSGIYYGRVISSPATQDQPSPPRPCEWSGAAGGWCGVFCLGCGWQADHCSASCAAAMAAGVEYLQKQVAPAVLASAVEVGLGQLLAHDPSVTVGASATAAAAH